MSELPISHYLASVAPVAALAVRLLLDPRVKPVWLSAKPPVPAIVGGLVAFTGTTLASVQSGDTWETAASKGLLAALATTGLGHAVGSLTALTPAAEAALEGEEAPEAPEHPEPFVGVINAPRRDSVGDAEAGIRGRVANYTAIRKPQGPKGPAWE